MSCDDVDADGQVYILIMLMEMIKQSNHECKYLNEHAVLLTS